MFFELFSLPYEVVEIEHPPQRASELKPKIGKHQNSGSAIQLGEAAMVKLGFRAHQASRAAKAFARHDRSATASLAAAHRDENAYVERVKQSLGDLEELSQEDNRRKSQGSSASWDTTQLREDIAEGEFSGPDVSGDDGSEQSDRSS